LKKGKNQGEDTGKYSETKNWSGNQCGWKEMGSTSLRKGNVLPEESPLDENGQQ
jgi:hypothetical protein